MATQMNEKPTDSPDFDPTTNEPVPPHIARMAAEAEARGRKALEGDGNTEGQETPPAAEGDEENPPEGSREPQQQAGQELPPKSGDEDVEALKHKLSVLQGKYDKEVPRLHAELQRATQIITKQQEMIDQLGQQATAQIEAAKPKIEPLNIEDYDAFGPEMKKLVEAVNAIAAQGGTDLSGPLKELASQQQQIAQRQGKLEFERFQDAVYRTAAQQTNRTPQEVMHVDTADEGFRDWLQATEPYTGKTRHELLVEAAHQGDLERTVAFYVSYLGTKKKPAAGAETGKSLENQVIPSGKATGTPQKSGAGELEAVRKKFQRATADFRAGRISEREHDKITAEYQQAIAKARR